MSYTKTWIQEGVSTADCDLSNYNAAVALPGIAGLSARVTDENDTPLVGIWLDWASTNAGVADFARIQNGPDVGNVVDRAVTMSYGNQTIGRNLVCGDAMGWTHVSAATNDPSISDEGDIHVTGLPTTGSAAVNPITMACDGQDYSTVSAYFTDSLGDPVADGTPVHFVVDEPGSVDPFDTTTVSGSATTSVSGISGVTTDLNITATSGAAEDSTSVECVDAMPPGDVNCSGSVSMVDAMLIAQKVAGLIDESGCATSAP